MARRSARRKKSGSEGSGAAVAFAGRTKLAGVPRMWARMFGNFIAWSGAKTWRRALMLVLLCAALFLPGFSANDPTDRDEARFAQASKQMLESGDFVDIRFQDDARHQKPIGIYWLQTAAASLVDGADSEIWAYRLPSLIAATIAVLLVSWAARPLVGQRASFLAAAMMAGVLVLSFEARTAKADAVLLAAVIAAQGALARLWLGKDDDKREHGWNVFYFWTALGVGFLIKGPIVLMPVLGSIAWMCAYEWSFSGLRRLGASWGVIWMLLIAAPWFAAIGVRTNGAFFTASLGEDMLAKVSAVRERHGAPPGAYLLSFLATFWPFTALAGLALPYVWRWRRAPDTAFLLGWIVPTWIVFELVVTKLPHYTMPLFPAIAALAAAAALDGSARPRGPIFWVSAILWALPALFLPIAFGIGPTLVTGEIELPSIIGGLASLAMLYSAWRLLRAGLWVGFVRSALMGAGLLYATAYLFSFPALKPIWISSRMVELAEPWRTCVANRSAAAEAGDVPLTAVRYQEPSFVFLAGTDTKLLSAEGAARDAAMRDGALVWVARRIDERRNRPDEIERFETAMKAAGATPRALEQTTGFQYNGGRELALTLYARDVDPTLAGCPAGRSN